MTSVLDLAGEVRARCPTLAIREFHLKQEGQYNDVLFVRSKVNNEDSHDVSNEFVFRFAKFEQGVAALQREAALLKTLSGKLSIPIPNPLYENFDSPAAGKSFMGYRLLPGIPLWAENFKAIGDANALTGMAHQLAGFLRELHSIPTATRQSIALPLADQVQEWIDLYGRIQTRLFPLMRAQAKRQVEAHFEGYFANRDCYAFVPVLRHGDFGTGNLLYDPTTLTITGVIDFGAAALGDPAIDYAGLLSFGENFCIPCKEVYPELEAMQERVRFYRGTFALQEALYGTEHGHAGALASGMQEYL